MFRATGHSQCEFPLPSSAQGGLRLMCNKFFEMLPFYSEEVFQQASPLCKANLNPAAHLPLSPGLECSRTCPLVVSLSGGSFLRARFRGFWGPGASVLCRAAAGRVAMPCVCVGCSGNFPGPLHPLQYHCSLPTSQATAPRSSLFNRLPWEL